MMTVMRTIIEVPDELIRSLDEIGERENCSRAALVREAITRYMEEHAIPAADEAFGLWKSKALDGLAYEAALRSDWSTE